MSTVNLQQARAELSQFVAQQPTGQLGIQAWRTAQGGLTAAELAARVDMANRQPPAVLLDEAQRLHVTAALAIEAFPELSRADFVAKFYGAGALARLEFMPGAPYAGKPSNSSEAEKFVAGMPMGPNGEMPWRDAHGKLLPSEHEARKTFTQSHPSTVIKSLMERYALDLDTFVDFSVDISRQEYIDRYYNPVRIANEQGGHNTGAPIVQPLGDLSQPKSGTVSDALLGVVQASVDANAARLDNQRQQLAREQRSISELRVK